MMKDVWSTLCYNVVLIADKDSGLQIFITLSLFYLSCMLCRLQMVGCRLIGA